MTPAAANTFLEPDTRLWGRRIAERRKRMGWSQTELAERLSEFTGQGVDQSVVSKFERGIRAPSDRQRPALARLLEVTVWWLFPYPEGDPR